MTGDLDKIAPMSRVSRGAIYSKATTSPSLVAEERRFDRRGRRFCKQDEVERFWAKVSPEPNSGCWLWLGFLDRGYGSFFADGRFVKAYRFAYERFVGPIPAGLVVDHKCRVRSCVNPDHLRAITADENKLIGFGPTATNARKTHCVRGHELAPSKRRCPACSRIQQREYRQYRKAIGNPVRERRHRRADALDSQLAGNPQDRSKE